LRKIHLLPQAVEDLDEIRDPQFSEVVARIQLLREFPSLGPVMDGFYLGYRCLTVGLFRVIYQVASKGDVEVAYIRHGRRELPD
jgi:plasmid stabilization system protein ParE